MTHANQRLGPGAGVKRQLHIYLVSYYSRCNGQGNILKVTLGQYSLAGVMVGLQ